MGDCYSAIHGESQNNSHITAIMGDWDNYMHVLESIKLPPSDLSMGNNLE